MKPIHLPIFLFFIFTLFSCNEEKTTESTEATPGTVTVTRVIDGDTFKAKEYSENIRLIGIDAPESRASQRKQVHPFGKKSAAYLKSLINKKSVRIEFDVEKHDQYGRLLAYVYTENGLFVNAEMIRQGYALLMTFPPNVKHANEFANLQREAREAKKGLWGEMNNDQ